MGPHEHRRTSLGDNLFHHDKHHGRYVFRTKLIDVKTWVSQIKELSVVCLEAVDVPASTSPLHSRDSTHVSPILRKSGVTVIENHLPKIILPLAGTVDMPGARPSTVPTALYSDLEFYFHEPQQCFSETVFSAYETAQRRLHTVRADEFSKLMVSLFNKSGNINTCRAAITDAGISPGLEALQQLHAMDLRCHERLYEHLRRASAAYAAVITSARSVTTCRNECAAREKATALELEQKSKTILRLEGAVAILKKEHERTVQNFSLAVEVFQPVTPEHDIGSENEMEANLLDSAAKKKRRLCSIQ